MEQKTTKKSTAILLMLYVIFAIAAFAVILIIPASREVFKTLSGRPRYIYPMGFLKFAILATAGELLAARMANGSWKKPSYLIARAAIWGVLGIGITYMMKVFSGGIDYMLYAGHYLPGAGKDLIHKILRAFYISTTMNLTFGPTFMAAHKITDAFLDLKAKGKPHGISDTVNAVDWSRFVSFTVFKTIPIFWIPAHTVTFLLPAGYQVMMAAALSVALGVILQLKRKPKTVEQSDATEGK